MAGLTLADYCGGGVHRKRQAGWCNAGSRSLGGRTHFLTVVVQ